MTTASGRKSRTRLYLRVTEDEKAKVKLAAAMLGMSVSRFVEETAREAAQRTIANASGIQPGTISSSPSGDPAS